VVVVAVENNLLLVNQEVQVVVLEVEVLLQPLVELQHLVKVVQVVLEVQAHQIILVVAEVALVQLEEEILRQVLVELVV
jgi:hypothetical protein